jgi:DNA processing protein
MRRVQEQGAQIVTFGCAQYPERLKEIYDPPPVLVGAGKCRELLGRASIAVVGTRHPTQYGTGMAEMLARDLAARGC